GRGVGVRAADRAPLVEMREISKRFGPVLANDRISLDLWPGEVHAVLGENGAGKTTLMNVLSGMYQPDAGTIRIAGEEVRIASPADALHRGIGTVYQHFTLVPNLSILENVVLGGNGGVLLDLSAAEERVTAMLADFGLDVSPHTEIRHLALGQRQRVEIIKVLLRGTRVLLLDEPTSVLTPGEVTSLLDLLRRLRDQGVAVVLITHKLGEALAVSDRVTILRGGRNAGEFGPDVMSGAARESVRGRIVEQMFGGSQPAEAPLPGAGTDSRVILRNEGSRPKVAAGRAEPRFFAGAQNDTSTIARSGDLGELDALLSLRHITTLGDRGAPALHDLSLDLQRGEVFGIAGVDGNGQKELGEVIAGQRHVTSGQVLLDGVDITNRGVAAATRLGIGYVTDDRLHEGSVAESSVTDNVALKSVGRKPFSNGIWLNRRAMEVQARRLIAEFDVKTPGPSTAIGMLSGGNIQKLLLARELALDPRVLVGNKPTAGLDLRTAQFIIQALREQADAGKVVVLISSELDELMEISDRIGVMYNGQLVAVIPRGEADLETLGNLMLGGTRRARRVPA
ncbi:MAG: ABC transporter ATP-binding protein, partial [Thermomicrobiales bacterium]